MTSTGERIGSYVIVHCLGQGGQGAVYKAFDPLLRRYIALKILSSEREQQEEIVREARLIARFDHPHIIQIYHIDRLRTRRGWFLAMEYLDGGTLESFLALHQGPLPLLDAVRFALHVANALECTHRHGIIHRDIKPSNLLLTDSRTLKVSDFGLATYSTHRFIPGQNVGTPHYMAPEIWLGEKADRPEGDIYALGACLYRMLAARPPFDAPDLDQLARLHLYTPPPDLLSFNPSLPPELCSLVMLCLEKIPERRFRSAKALQQALLRFSNGASLPSASLDAILLSSSKDNLNPLPLPFSSDSLSQEALPPVLSGLQFPYLRWFGLQAPLGRFSLHKASLAKGSLDSLRLLLFEEWLYAGGSPRPWISTDALLLLSHLSGGEYPAIFGLLHKALFLAFHAKLRLLTSWTIQGAFAHPGLLAALDDIQDPYRFPPASWPDQVTLALLQTLRLQAAETSHAPSPSPLEPPFNPALPPFP